MKQVLFLFILLNTVRFVAQDYSLKNIESLVNTNHTERTIQLKEFYEIGLRFLDSTEIFTTIKKVESLSKKNSDNELFLETKLMRVHYYAYRNKFKEDFVINKILELDKIAKSDNILWLEIRTQSLLANYIYNSVHNYGLGFEHFVRTAQLLENVTGEEYPLKQICLYQLARVFEEFKEYKNAIQFLQKAKDTKSKYNSYYYEMHIFNSLGDAHRKINNLDSSNYYFNVTLQKALKAKDRVWEGISYGNIGYNYFLAENYEQAEPLLTLDVEIALENKDWRLASNSLSHLSNIQIIKSNFSEANRLINLASYYAHKSNDYSPFVNIYPLQSKIASYQLKPELATKYLDSTIIVNDSLAKLFDTKKLIRAQQRIDIDKQKIKEEQEKQRQAKRIWIRNTIITVLVLLVLIGFLLYNRYRLRNKNKELLIVSEKQLALQKLEAATTRLQDFKQSILKKNITIEQLERSLVNVHKKKNKEEDSNTLAQLEKAAILTEKDWREFSFLFEQVHIDFFKRLKIKYPHLTSSETKLLTLSRLQLDNKEMALMLGVGTSAIRQVKSRFRKKYNLEEGNSIQKLAKTI